MVDQNTDRSGWGMIALVTLGIALTLIKVATSDIGNLVVDQIKNLFTGA